MKRTLAAASMLAAASLVLTACAGGAGEEAASAAPTELKIGNFLDVVSWDPSLADIGFNGPYLSAVYDPLIALNGDGEPVPALATDWQVSDDALTITLDLRKDATFSNGESFDAEVAAQNLEFLKEGVTSREAYLNVESFEVVDEDTVAIHLSERDDRLLYFMGLGRSYMAAPAAIEANSLAESPVGSGPYTLADTTIPGAEYHFEKVEGHWADAEFPFESVTVLPLQDPSARNNAMEAGQINVAFADPTTLELAEAHGWNVAEKVAAWSGIRINDHTGDTLAPLGDARVRQALGLAFDGAAMLEAIGQGYGVHTNQVFAAGYPGYDEALNERAVYDLERAKKLLAEAGYADGFDVTMPMAPAFQPWQATVEQAFNDLGVRLTWDEYQMADYQANAGSYPMFLVSLAVDAEPVATIARQLTVPQWYMPEPDISTNAELQAQVDRALAAPRGEAQDAEVLQLSEMLVDEGWFVPWYQSSNLFVTDPGITLEPVTGMMFPTLRQIQPVG